MWLIHHVLIEHGIGITQYEGRLRKVLGQLLKFREVTRLHLLTGRCEKHAVERKLGVLLTRDLHLVALEGLR